jgi:hypothetical protein
MQSHVRSLSERVDRLERQNRRLRWLLLGLPVVALLVGAQAQQAVWKGKTVVAEEFILNDPNGKTRASLRVEKDGPRLMLTDKDGRVRVSLAGDSEGDHQKDGPHLWLMDKDGRVRVNLAADNDGNGPGLHLANATGKLLATLRTAKNLYGMLGLYENEQMPILIASRSDAYGVGCVEFFDGNGHFKSSVGGK